MTPMGNFDHRSSPGHFSIAIPFNHLHKATYILRPHGIFDIIGIRDSMYLRPNYRVLFVLTGVATTLLLMVVLILALRRAPVDNKPPPSQATVVEGVLEERAGHFFVQGYRLTGQLDQKALRRAIGYTVRVAGTVEPGVVAGEIKIITVLNVELKDEIPPRKGWVWHASKGEPFFVIAVPAGAELAPTSRDKVTYLRGTLRGEDAVYFDVRIAPKGETLDPPDEYGLSYAELNVRPATGVAMIGGYLYDEIRDEETRIVRPSKSCEAQIHCPHLVIEARGGERTEVNTIIQSIAFAPRFSGWQMGTFSPPGALRSVHFQYPPEWSVREETTNALRLTGGENELVRLSAAQKIEKPRAPWLLETESFKLPTIKYGTRYHTQDELGNPVDRFIFKLPDGTYEIEAQGTGAIFEAILRSLEVVR